MLEMLNIFVYVMRQIRAKNVDTNYILDHEKQHSGVHDVVYMK